MHRMSLAFIVHIALYFISPTVSRATTVPLIDSSDVAVARVADSTWSVSVTVTTQRTLRGKASWAVWASPGWYVEFEPTLIGDHNSGFLLEARLHARDTPKEGSLSQLVITLNDEAMQDPAPLRIGFITRDGDLQVISMKDELSLLEERIDSELYVLKFQGEILNSETMIDSFPADYMAIAEAQMEEATSRIDAPLQASPAESSGAAAESGCTSGVSSGVTALLALGMLRLRRRSSTALTIIVLSTVSVAGGARAVQRCVVGVTAWWDGREEEVSDHTPFPDHDYPGFRLKVCNPENKSCYPSASDCCFTALRGIEVHLINSATGVIVSQSTSDPNQGVFTLCDPNWATGKTYHVMVKFAHGPSYPAQFSIKTETGNTIYSFITPIGQLTSSPTVIGVLSANSPGVAGQAPPDLGDLSSVWWGVAQNWNSAWEAMTILDSLGEQRIRRAYGSSGFTQIDLRTWTQDKDDAICSTSTVRFNPSHNAMAHELGHILHGRILGCSSAAPGLPAFPAVGNISPHCPFRAAEGVTLTESLADIPAMLASWDPATASTSNVVLKSWICDPNVWGENDVLDRFRLSMALWDIIDTASDHTDSWADTEATPVPEVYNALQLLKNTPGTFNRQSGEQVFTFTGATCSSPPGCSALTTGCLSGQVCGADGKCYGGDPHGANISDLVYYMYPGTYETYWKTIESGYCVGMAKDSAPFNGGYRKL